MIPTRRLAFDILSLVWVLLLITTGCLPQSSTVNSKKEKPPAEPVTLRLIVVDDEVLGARIEREWTARTGTDLVVKNVSSSEFVGSLKDRRIPADAVVYPSAMLGELAARESIVPFRDEDLDDPRWDHRSVLGLARRQESMWGQRTVAISLGSPIFMLYYRKDIFGELGLSPPTTWAEYENVRAHLASHVAAKEAAGEKVGWIANVEPLSSGWAGRMLLARAASYARHKSSYSSLFNYATLEPFIDRPPFLRALEELVAAVQPSKEQVLHLSPTDTRKLIHEGGCAMAITWPSPAAKVGDENKNYPLGIANLPGGQDVYQFRERKWEKRSNTEHVPLLGVSGRLVSVAKSSRYLEDATGFALWLTGSELGATVSAVSESTTIFRKSQFNEARDWVESNLDASSTSDYVKALESAHASSSWLVSPNLPGHLEYIEALDTAVQAAVRGERTPQDSLNDVAAKWKAISDKLGVEKQRRAYEQSLGISP